MMILGLDISTSITGATVLDKEGNIIYNEAWDTRRFKNMFVKAEHIKESILDAFESSIDSDSTIKHIFISKRILISKNSIYFIQVQWYCVVDVL